MKLLELGVLYGLVGVGCAAVCVARRGSDGRTWVDAVLLLGFWPLYGPFLLARGDGAEDGPAGSEIAFLAALRRASGTPLAALLPDQASVIALARRLRVAAAKVKEIDGLLERPEFSEQSARDRREELKNRGASEVAVSTASIRIQNIHRLRGLRDRFARELDEVGELLAQFKTQAEVVRLAGAPDAETRDLIQELVSRVEGLDRMLDDDPYAALEPGWRQSWPVETAKAPSSG